LKNHQQSQGAQKQQRGLDPTQIAPSDEKKSRREHYNRGKTNDYLASCISARRSAEAKANY
jgi:hypothetical protein